MELDTKAASAAHPDVSRVRRQMVAFAKVAARAHPDFDFATARRQMAAYARAAEAMKDREPASRAFGMDVARAIEAMKDEKAVLRRLRRQYGSMDRVFMGVARAIEAMKDREPASRAFSMDADFIDAGSYGFRV